MAGLELVLEQMKAVRQRSLTVPEAAAVFDTDASELRRAVDRGLLQASFTPQGARRYRLLAADRVLAWMMAKPLRPDYHEAFSNSLFESKSWHVESNQVFLSFSADDKASTVKYNILLDDIFGKITQRLKALDDAQAHVEVRKGADPVIRGTGIEVHRIAALLDGGARLEEVVHDFPELTEDQIVAAVAYARAHPKQGRPYPGRSAKAAMRAGRGGLRRAFIAAEDE